MKNSSQTHGNVLDLLNNLHFLKKKGSRNYGKLSRQYEFIYSGKKNIFNILKHFRMSVKISFVLEKFSEALENFSGKMKLLFCEKHISNTWQ